MMRDFYDTPDDEDVPVDLAGDLADEATVASCPYCGAQVEILLDTGGAAEQEYVEDCEVCCRPWTVRVRWDDGTASVELTTEDGE